MTVRGQNLVLSNSNYVNRFYTWRGTPIVKNALLIMQKFYFSIDRVYGKIEFLHVILLIFLSLCYKKIPKWAPLSHVTPVAVSLSFISRGENESPYKIVDHFCIRHVTNLFQKTLVLF